MVGCSDGVRPQDALLLLEALSDKGVFARIMEGLAAEHSDLKAIMIDATYLQAHRTALILRLKDGGVDV